MFQIRTLTTGFLVAALGVGAGLAVFAPADALAGDKKPCKHAKEIDAVKKMCEDKGFDEVKKAMKAAQSAAKKAGADKEKVDCKHCHSNTDDYPSTDNAVKDFKEFMAPHFKG
jgi:Tfp pilus assembly major pilin PilA